MMKTICYRLEVAGETMHSLVFRVWLEDKPVISEIMVPLGRGHLPSQINFSATMGYVQRGAAVLGVEDNAWIPKSVARTPEQQERLKQYILSRAKSKSALVGRLEDELAELQDQIEDAKVKAAAWAKEAERYS